MDKKAAILGGALVFAITLSVSLFPRLSDTRAEPFELTAQAAGQEVVRLQPAAQAPAPMLKSDPETADSNLTSSTSEPGPPSAHDQIAAAIQVARTPEGQALLQATKMKLVRSTYPDIGEVLLLSPKEEDELLNILLIGSEESRKAELTAALGSKYELWEQYSETRPTRNQLQDLEERLGSSDNALTSHTKNTLVQILSRIDPEVATLYPGNSEQQQRERIEESYRRRMEAASPYLSPQQLETFKLVVAKDRTFALARLSVGRRVPSSTQ